MTEDKQRPTERLARAISKAKRGTEMYWPNYLLAAVAARNEMNAIRAGLKSPDVIALFGPAPK